MSSVVVSCDLPRSTIFFARYLTIFEGGGEVIEHKMCVLNLSTTFVCNISHFKKNSARYDQKCVLIPVILVGF